MKKLLVSTKYLMLIPVVGSILMTIAIVIMGVGRIIYASIISFETLDFSAKAAKKLSTVVIETIDLFLVGTVSYITALGLYKLFISRDEIQLPIRLKIETIKDLEDKIIGVIVAALAVAFLGAVANEPDITLIIYYGAGIALVVISLSLFMWLTSKSEKTKSEEKNE